VVPIKFTVQSIYRYGNL